MPFPITFRALLLLAVVLVGGIVLFVPAVDPRVERRRLVLRTTGMFAVVFATALLAAIALIR